jgi:hypothetical protein
MTRSYHVMDNVMVRMDEKGSKYVHISVAERARKKFITTVKGLETYGISLKKAASTFSKRSLSLFHHNAHPPPPPTIFTCCHSFNLLDDNNNEIDLLEQHR